MRRSYNGPRRNPSGRDPRPQERGQGRPQAKGLGGDQVEGRRAVRELLAAEKRRVREIWIADGANENDVLVEIMDLAHDMRVPVKTVGRDSLLRAAHSDAPQGVLAYAEPLREYELDELIDPSNNPFLLAFDGVTDPHNLGALVRTGECAGVTGVILPRHRSVHVTPTVAKASAGAIEHVPMAMVAGLPNALKECKDAGVWTVGLDMDGDTDIHDLTVADQPLVLVFGAEGKGLSRLTKQRCDVLARIPQYGNVASLNVSAAGAIACFEVARRRA
jgi:23S rRNA (guanosine2251-2'-O)-methyltransferase